MKNSNVEPIEDADSISIQTPHSVAGSINLQSVSSSSPQIRMEPTKKKRERIPEVAARKLPPKSNQLWKTYEANFTMLGLTNSESSKSDMLSQPGSPAQPGPSNVVQQPIESDASTHETANYKIIKFNGIDDILVQNRELHLGMGKYELLLSSMSERLQPMQIFEANGKCLIKICDQIKRGQVIEYDDKKKHVKVRFIDKGFVGTVIAAKYVALFLFHFFSPIVLSGDRKKKEKLIIL